MNLTSKPDRAMMLTLTTLVVIVLALSSCSSAATPGISTNQPTSTARPASDVSVRPALPQFLQASYIRIEDDWDSNDPRAPVKAHFILERVGDQFVGTARFSAGGYSGEELDVTQNITIPLTTINTFLTQLAEAPLETNAYVIPPTIPDCYNSRIIIVETESASIAFSLASACETHTWQIVIYRNEQRTQYLSRSDIPLEAAAILEPFFRRDAQQNLFKQIESRR